MSTNAPAYSATFIYNGGGFEGFSVPVSGVYHVDLYGAQGGAAFPGAAARDGGKGAAVGGDIYLQEGAELSFGVGQAGQPGSTVLVLGSFGGGGGGGTFLFELPPNGDHYILLAVAGGGGGGATFLSRALGNATNVGGGGIATKGTGGEPHQGIGGEPGVNGGPGKGGFHGGGGGGWSGGQGGSPSVLNNSPSGADGVVPSMSAAFFLGGPGGTDGGAGGFGGGGGGGGGAGGGGGGYGGGGGGEGTDGLNAFLIIAPVLSYAGGGGGSYLDASFTNVTRTNAAHSGNGLATIFLDSAPVCFLSGTRILTQRGEVAVEDLRVGDPVVALVHGGLLPVRWIGNRRVRPLHYRNPDHAHPIRVQEGAFGPGMPHRDLWLTPGHRVLVDGHLVQIDTLLNDTTIAQVKQDEIHVFHIELDRHDVILADGMASETFLDVGNRAAFEDSRVVPLDPDFMPHDEDATCLPVQRDPAMLDALKVRLEARAEALGWTRTQEAGLHLLADGRVVEAERDGADWVFRLDAPADEVWLMSRWYVPAHRAGDLPDPRQLGVAVASLAVDGRMHDLHVPAEGWHKRETDQGGVFRWTTGRARLPSGGSFRLRLVHPRQYWWAGEQMAPQSDSGFLLRAGSGLVQQQMNLFSACNKSYAMGLSGSLVGVLTH